MAVMMKDNVMKRGDTDFQYADNIVAVIWYDNRGVTPPGTCLQGCNQISSASQRVKDKSAKTPVPCPSIVKKYNNGMVGVDHFDQQTAAYKSNRKSSSKCYYLRLFFDLMGIVIAKSLIGAYNRQYRNTSITLTSRREVLPASVPLHLPVIQTTRGKSQVLLQCWN